MKTCLHREESGYEFMSDFTLSIIHRNHQYIAKFASIGRFSEEDESRRRTRLSERGNIVHKDAYTLIS